MAWLAYLLGVFTLPAAYIAAIAALLGYERAVKAVRERRKKPASEMIHGLCRAIGEEDRRVSQRFILGWRWKWKWQWQLMLFKEGPNEPTKKFLWPREPEPLDDEE